jgi:DNA gyrase subunit A
MAKYEEEKKTEAEMKKSYQTTLVPDEQDEAQEIEKDKELEEKEIEEKEGAEEKKRIRRDYI